MNRTPVESSNLVSVGHDPSVNILQVEFKGGAIYNYFQVPPSVFNDLMAAESCGKFLNAVVKPTYNFEKLEQGPIAELAQNQNQKQLDADGILVGVSRQALDEVMRDLHFLRFFHQVFSQSVNKSDDPIHETYADHYGWPAPAKYLQQDT